MAFVLTSCSQYKNNIFSKSFHNLTARYNAYFLAREKMKEVESEIWKDNKDDYNKPLKIYPTIDEQTQKRLIPETDEVIKKAALPVQKHKNSNWVDDSYILIGMSRIYRGEYPLAAETFKYVNTKSKDKNARHLALVWLIRTFIHTEDHHSIPAVVDYLKKGKLNDDNSRDFHLIMAYFHQQYEEYDKVIESLNLAIPNIKKRDQRSRMHFILGQLYQLKGNDQESYNNYKQVLKNNPPYELSFYTRLYMAQVTELSATNDVKKVEKYFKKLLKDAKNVDYKDKIYYEMGMFKLKQNDHKKAIKNFENSIEASTGNNFQKARSYHELGKLYYEKLQKYELAKAYYDSTVELWDKRDKEYKPIFQRQQILEDFVIQINTIQREDSLQRLARMDSAALSMYLDKLILDQEKKQREEQKRMAEAAKKKTLAQAGAAANMGDGAGGWYFYNPNAVNMGRIEFDKVWGRRKLEDNWRRSVKEVDFSYEEEEEEELKEEVKIDSAALRAQEKARMYSNLPLTKADMDSSNNRVEEAMYKLGKIYDLNLHEPDNSITTFEKLLERFAQSEHRPEVMYFLYTLFTDRNEEKKNYYKTAIFNEFPNSLYAKIIKNPNYLQESKALNEKVAKLYKEAYAQYERKDYFNAEKSLESIINNYPENDIEDKLEFLSILIKGKTKNAIIFKSLLENFMITYTNSTLLPKAQELLDITDNYITKSSGGEAIEVSDVKYINNLSKPHYFVVAFPKERVVSSRINSEFNIFHKQLSGFEVETEYLEFNITTTLMVVKGFDTKEKSLDYVDYITSVHSFLNNYKPYYKTFIITDDNFRLLKESGKIEPYERFYKAFYE